MSLPHRNQPNSNRSASLLKLMQDQKGNKGKGKTTGDGSPSRSPNRKGKDGKGTQKGKDYTNTQPKPPPRKSSPTRTDSQNKAQPTTKPAFIPKGQPKVPRHCAQYLKTGSCQWGKACYEPHIHQEQYDARVRRMTALVASLESSGAQPK